MLHTLWTIPYWRVKPLSETVLFHNFVYSEISESNNVWKGWTDSDSVSRICHVVRKYIIVERNCMVCVYTYMCNILIGLILVLLMEPCVSSLNYCRRKFSGEFFWLLLRICSFGKLIRWNLDDLCYNMRVWFRFWD